MKKFMKTCAVIVAVMLALSIILLTAGGCGGGLRGLSRAFWRGFNCYGCHLGEADEWFEKWGEKLEDWSWGDDWNTYDPDSDSLFNSFYDVIENKDKWSDSFSAENISNLQLELGGCEVTFGISPDAEYHVSAKSIKKMQAYVSGDTLYVRVTTTGQINSLNTKVEILIPEGAVFDEVEASMGAGDFKIASLSADTIKMEIGAGRLQTEKVTARELKIELGAGQVVIKDAVVSGKFEAEIGAGELRFTGSVPGDMDVECAMGNADIHITGSSEKDHNYDLECSAGNMTVGSRSHTGVAFEDDINNGADSEYKLSCFMGNLKVTFSE